MVSDPPDANVTPLTEMVEPTIATVPADAVTFDVVGDVQPLGTATLTTPSVIVAAAL